MRNTTNKRFTNSRVCYGIETVIMGLLQHLDSGKQDEAGDEDCKKEGRSDERFSVTKVEMAATATRLFARKENVAFIFESALVLYCFILSVTFSVGCFCT